MSSICFARRAGPQRDAARELVRTARPSSAAIREWYKDAIIYQLHIKAFFDANGDGVGDFAGLLRASSTTCRSSA